MGKPQDPRFRDKDTENFYHSERVLKFQELSRSEKQESRRKVVIIYRAKSWKEITTYFPYVLVAVDWRSLVKTNIVSV